MTERGAQGWLTIIGPFLGIHEKLDDRTIGDAYDKVEVLHILQQICIPGTQGLEDMAFDTL